MKKLVLVFSVFCLVSMGSLLPSSDNTQRPAVIDNDKKDDSSCKSQLKKFCSQYCASVVLSGCIGALTGGCVRWMEKQLNFEASPMALFLYLLSWSLESEFRDELVEALQKDLDSYGIEHRKNLMFRTAQIASWMMYMGEYA